MPTLGELRGKVDSLIEAHGEGSPVAATFWHPGDVRSMAENNSIDLTDDEVAAVLDRMVQNFDPVHGISWDHVENEINAVVELRGGDGNS